MHVIAKPVYILTRE